MESFIPVLKSSLTIMTPILFAAAGGLFPALAGTLNIALEGLLLTGAFASIAVYHYSANVAASIAAAVLASLALSALHAFGAFKLRANVFISGLAVNLFAGGLCVVLSDKIFNTRGVVALTSVPGLLKWYLVIGLLLLIAAWFVIYKTPFGYRLRACEKSESALYSLGISAQFYRISALLISGFLAGLGGSFLSLNLGAFVPGMSAGKGWIALVVIFLGGRKPQGILAAAFVFALAEALSNYAQGYLTIPADFILAFPYVCTLIAMIAVSAFPYLGKALPRRRSQSPLFRP
jgi:simple sugar transport system permease protein